MNKCIKGGRHAGIRPFGKYKCMEPMWDAAPTAKEKSPASAGLFPLEMRGFI